MDTALLYIEKKHLEKLKVTDYAGEDLGQGKSN